MKIEFVCVSHNTDDTTPSFILHFDDGSYLFNIPDGTQRIFMENKWKVSRVKTMFLTSNEYTSMGGMIGMILTMSTVDNYSPPKIVGPSPTKDQMLHDLSYKLNPEFLPEILENYKDDNLAVTPIILSRTTAYDIQLKDYPGKFLPQKAKELGVPAGPLFKKLVAGESITLEDGRVINSSDCVTAPTHGDKILVLDARSINDVKQIDNIDRYNLIVHLTPKELLVSEEYCNIFNNNKSINVCFTYDNTIIYKTINDLYSTLASNDSISFLNPLSRSNKKIPLPEFYKQLSTQDMYIIAPLEKKKFISAVTKPTKLEEFEGTIPTFETFAVTCLGTGARQPSKMRNTSGYMLHTKESNVVLDCGEDYTGQLRRKFGLTIANELMKSTKLIWISHVHGDHLFGLLQFLTERSKLTDEEVILQADNEIIQLIQYDEKLLDTSFHCKYINSDVANLEIVNIKVESIPVNHCDGSHGAVFTIDNKWRFAYTGDKNQNDDFIEKVGKCDLLLHEATYENEEIDEAIKYGHSTIGQAIAAGKQLGAKCTILTHASARYSSNALKEKTVGSFLAFDYLFIPFEKTEEIEQFSDEIFTKILEEPESV